MEAKFNLILKTSSKKYHGIVSTNLKNPEFKIPGDQRQFIIGIDPIDPVIDKVEEGRMLYDDDEDEDEGMSGEEDNDEDGMIGGDEGQGTSGDDEDDQVEKMKPTERGGGTGSRNSDPNKRNKKRCLDLEAQLAKGLNRDKWAISLKLKIHKDYIVIADEDMRGRHKLVMTSVDVSLEGEVLDKLRSLMLYQIRGGWLKMKLYAKLTSLATNPNPDPGPVDYYDYRYRTHPYYEQYDSFIITDLLPRAMEVVGVDGCDHVKYEATNVQLKNEPFSHNGCTVLFEPPTKANERWGLSSIRLIIEGTCSDFDKAPPKSSDMGMAAGTNKMMLESGLFADLKIIGGNGAIVSCHSAVLLVRSPVIAAKFSGRFESDANKERTMELREWSKDEITAFLEYVYYGGTKNAVESPSLAMAVFEIGLYLLVQEVEQAMEGILLTRPAEWFSVDAGLGLYQLWMKYGKKEFQRKALDVLGIRTDEEINSSELFAQLLSSADLREEFMTSRKRF